MGHDIFKPNLSDFVNTSGTQINIWTMKNIINTCTAQIYPKFQIKIDKKKFN